MPTYTTKLTREPIPYQRNSMHPFHITFYEMTHNYNDEEHNSEQPRDEGLLFPEDSRDYDRAKKFQRSAFTVGLSYLNKEDHSLFKPDHV